MSTGIRVLLATVLVVTGGAAERAATKVREVKDTVREARSDMGLEAAMDSVTEAVVREAQVVPAAAAAPAATEG